MPTQNQNGQPLNLAQTPGCGLCEICSKGVSNELSKPSPGDRGRRFDGVEKLQKLRIYYKESGQLVKAMAIQSAIEAIR